MIFPLRGDGGSDYSMKRIRKKTWNKIYFCQNAQSYVEMENLYQHFRRDLRVVTPQNISSFLSPISSQYIIRKSQPLSGYVYSAEFGGIYKFH